MKNVYRWKVSELVMCSQVMVIDDIIEWIVDG